MKRKTTLIIIIIAVIAALAALAVKLTVFAPYKGESVRVNIPKNAGDDAIATIFEKQLGAHYGVLVKLLWKLQDGTAARSHGSYLIEPGTPAVNIARNIAKGRQTPVKFTFNNIRFFEDLAGRASAVLELDSAAFMAAADSIFKEKGFKSPEEYSAAILPDTYEFWWTASPATVAGTLAEHRSKFWNDERRAKARKLGLTPVQVHTLASIVEEETNKADERPKVARLYLNRLDRDMPLQSDPTLKFASGDFGARRVTSKHLASDSPYNTYTNKGLPPGPIRIVEARTLDAVLDAPAHSFIYMCAKADFSGYHDFATDYQRHLENARKYHKALDARGIK